MQDLILLSLGLVAARMLWSSYRKYGRRALAILLTDMSESEVMEVEWRMGRESGK